MSSDDTAQLTIHESSLPMGVSARKGRLFFASMRRNGTNWGLHVFAALGFKPAANRLRERYVREWLQENSKATEDE